MPAAIRPSSPWRIPPTVGLGYRGGKQPHVAALQRDAALLLSLRAPSVRSYLSRWGRITPQLIRLQLKYPDDAGVQLRLGAIRGALADVLPVAPSPASYRELAKAYFELVDWWTEYEIGNRIMTKSLAQRGLVAVRRLIARLHEVEKFLSDYLEGL